MRVRTVKSLQDAAMSWAIMATRWASNTSSEEVVRAFRRWSWSLGLHGEQEYVHAHFGVEGEWRYELDQQDIIGLAASIDTIRRENRARLEAETIFPLIN